MLFQEDLDLYPGQAAQPQVPILDPQTLGKPFF